MPRLAGHLTPKPVNYDAILTAAIQRSANTAVSLSGKVYSQSIKISPANSSVATILNVPSASHPDGSSKSSLKHTASGIVVVSLADSSARPSAKEPQSEKVSSLASQWKRSMVGAKTPGEAVLE